MLDQNFEGPRPLFKPRTLISTRELQLLPVFEKRVRYFMAADNTSLTLCVCFLFCFFVCYCLFFLSCFLSCAPRWTYRITNIINNYYLDSDNLATSYSFKCDCSIATTIKINMKCSSLLLYSTTSSLKFCYNKIMTSYIYYNC